MHKITIFPLGNADCCRIDLEGGEKILFDCAHTKNFEDPKDKRCDLHAELREDLGERDYYDVVAFTHLDRDHFARSSEFFHFEHAKKYQGEGRIKINVMWVPAGLITEECPEDPEACIIQAEARYRLRQGAGIRIFSRPERLKDWCEKNGIDLEKRKHLLTDAGNVAPDFTIPKHGVDFFVHSPFGHRQDDYTVVDRNGDSIVMQATFQVGGIQTKALLMADTHAEAMSEIVQITKSHKNDHRLEWDIVKLPHHCSYRSLNENEKGEDKTTPIPDVTWLYETQGQDGGMIVSTSEPIPLKGTKEDDDPQPPHRQAAKYYQDMLKKKDGRFVVTMEHPTVTSPEAVVIEIDSSKATLKMAATTAAAAVISRPAPRAG